MPEDTITEAEVDFCQPETKIVYKDKIVYKEKIVYKDRIKVVKLPVKVEPKIGCNVNWKTQKVMLYAPQGYKITCKANWQTKEFHESIIPPGSIRRKRTSLPLRRRL